MVEIRNLIEELAINNLAAGVDKSRHDLLLEKFLEKNPISLQATMEIFERRLTLQEVVGSIQSFGSPRPRKYRSFDRFSRWEYHWNNNPSDRPERRTNKPLPYADQRERLSRTSKGSNTSVMSLSKLRTWPPRPREERDFTKLNTDRASILAILKAKPSYKPPRPMNPKRFPSDRYCDYYEDTGHTTERCYPLKNLTEDKLQNGQLSHFIQRNNAP